MKKTMIGPRPKREKPGSGTWPPADGNLLAVSSLWRLEPPWLKALAAQGVVAPSAARVAGLERGWRAARAVGGEATSEPLVA